MDCQLEKNKVQCSCTYESCSRRGLCCECVSYHRAKNEAPGCLFPPEIEKTYDRSIKKLIASR